MSRAPAKARSAKKAKGPTPVESLKHMETRVSIPTEELREFVKDDEASPKSMLYPRDPSLDPQLVWKGKDEQDSKPLEVPVVPIYIQEKIHPQALIENLRDTSKAGEREPELTLFDDFNGIRSLEDKVTSFYSHDAGRQPHWSNRMILGDSLLVMTSLAEKEGLKGKVQMIYLDPPYGIKFGSNWQVSTRKRDVKDGKVEDATRQPEQVKAFRDTWQLGIHSYLAYLRDRLVAARDLLTESGSIFVQIGDENVHLVRSLLDEVFGSENFVTQIAFQKTGGFAPSEAPAILDYLLWYSKVREVAKLRPLFAQAPRPPIDEPYYVLLETGDGQARGMTREERRRETPLPSESRIFRYGPLTSDGKSKLDSTYVFEGREFEPPRNSHWKTTAEGLARLGKAGRLIRVGNNLGHRLYWDYFPAERISNIWLDTQSGGFGDQKVYVVQTTPTVVERCLLATTDPGDLVLDPTCGSGTTAAVAEQWGRRWITFDTSRVALALARTRLMGAKYPFYLLADSEEGRRKEAEVTGSTAVLQSGAAPGLDVKKGFVYERVPHVTLKSIANNEEIDEIHERFAKRITPLSEAFEKGSNKGKSKGGALLEEWQVPRESDDGWPEELKKVHVDFWRLRRERQKEIEASIARRADTELLFDRPYQDTKRIRVAGPFTVESLSPHRVLSTDEERPKSEAEARAESTASFPTTILENLRKAGVQNTRKNERLKFDRLEPFPGKWIHFAGDFSQGAGEVKRVAVSLGPEHGTVGPTQIQEAAKEAVKGVGFDLLLVLGFAFDAHAAETAQEVSPAPIRIEEGFIAEAQREFGRLPVLLVRMNPDLAMGEDLLKKTGAGNLFLVFGEPDVEIRKRTDGKLEIEIRGVDVYDPTTGVVRSSTTDDIACWFIDTNYDEESFFVRHAYFTGEGEPYEKLKRALRADIDEAAWSSLYSTVSRPFDPPTTGKLAVKVINHYGDEVLKVYST